MSTNVNKGAICLSFQNGDLIFLKNWFIF